MAAREEDPFELINKGNAFEAASDHWRSAEFYSRASVCLRRKADDLSSQIRNGGADAKKWKVVSLFRAQSLEYMFKARHCLLEALRFENDQDRSRTLEVAKTGTGSLDPLCSLITPEESEKRKLTFLRVFSGGGEALKGEADVDVTDIENQVGASIEPAANSAQIEVTLATEGDKINDTDSPQLNSSVNVAEPSPAGDQVDDRQQAIECRLADLDSSLLPKVPPPFISGSRGNGGGNSQNRLEEIKRGLGRLGVSLPDSNVGKPILIPDNRSTEDQVKLIIQQAQDEVCVERGLHAVEGAKLNDLVDTTQCDDHIDENDSMFEGFEEDDYDIDALLAKAENLVTKTGTGADAEDKFFSELAQIRKVQALLLEARLCLEIVHAKTSDEQMLLNNSKETESEGKRKVDASDAASEDSVETEVHVKTSSVAKKKAKELVENAQNCMEKILKDWK